MPNSDVLIQTVMGEFKCTTERNYENDITLKVRDRIDFLKQNIDQIYRKFRNYTIYCLNFNVFFFIKSRI